MIKCLSRKYSTLLCLSSAIQEILIIMCFCCNMKHYFSSQYFVWHLLDISRRYNILLLELVLNTCRLTYYCNNA